MASLALVELLQALLWEASEMLAFSKVAVGVPLGEAMIAVSVEAVSKSQVQSEPR